jgi:diacylglycerol kinase family enzyme
MATRRIVAILNRGGGSYKASSEAELTSIVGDAGSLEVKSVQSSALAGALKEAAADADLVIVLGGDGTMALAASILGPNGPPMIMLPGGTMNRLVHRLYGKGDWRDTLRRTLADPATVMVEGGMAGADLFLISAIFGMPSDWSGAREALRKGRLSLAVELAIAGVRHAMSRRVSFRSDSTSGSAHAVAVRCAGAWSLPPREPSLEAAALNASSLAAFLRLGADALMGEPRKNPDVQTLEVTHLTISREGGVPTMLDGESRLLAPEVEVRFVREAFRILVPASK